MNIEDTLKKLNSILGTGAVVRMGDAIEPVKAVSFGSAPLDIASGIGGCPVGRIVEIFGAESSGKTTITLHAISEFQKKGICAFIDVEHALDPDYATALGVNMNDLLVSQPGGAEEVFKIAKTLAKTDGISLIVVDSVPGMTTEQERESNEGDANISSLARMMSAQLKQLCPILSLHDVTMIFTNQLRERPGVMYGNPEYQPGGRALKFFSSMRLRVSRKAAPNTSAGVATSSETTVKFVKNKCAPPFSECEFNISFGKGVDNAAWVFERLEKSGSIKRRGSSYILNASSKEIPLGSGKKEAMEGFLPYLARSAKYLVDKSIKKK